MRKQQQKKKTDSKQKVKRLRLNKETIKDLEPNEPSAVKGGRPIRCVDTEPSSNC